MTTKRNGKIELLRFFFCLSVLIFHLNEDVFGGSTLSTPVFSLFAHGRTGVEFFFLVSGFLCAKKADENRKLGTPIGTDTFNFIFKKVKVIFPYHIITLVILLSVIAIFNRETFWCTLPYKLPGIFFLQRTGLSRIDANSVEWYIAAMLLALVIVYPLLRKWYDFTINVIAPVGSVLIIGYLIQVYGEMPSVSNFGKFTYLCNIRALGVILLGVFAYNVSSRIRAREFSKAARGWLVFAEDICWAFGVYFVFSSLEGYFECYAAFAMAAGVALTFSRDFQGRFYNSPFVMYLGKISLPIYLIQNAVRWFSDSVFIGHMSLVARLLLQIAISVAMGIAIYEFWNFVKKCRAKKHLTN